MRRYLSGGLLFILIGQASGAALANTSGDVHVTGLNLGSVIAPLLSAIEGSQIVAQLTGNGDRYTLMHMPMPHLSRHERTSATAFPDVRPSRLATRVVVRGIPETMHFPTRPPRERTRDPRAMHRASSSAASSLIPSQAGSSHRLPGTGGPVERQTGQSASQVLAPQSSGVAITQQPSSSGQRPSLTPKALSKAGKPAPNNPSPQILAASDVGAGINAYWTYQERTIPGVGTAMLNVGTGNLVVQTSDVDIPERGLDLAFTRTYNSQSLHDSNGDDGSEPSIFGNLWTNSYDAHIIFRYNGQNINAISVYDVDGTRCDYTPNGNGGWVPCVGQHAILEVDPSNSCSYWWIKKNGTAFWFHTDSLGSCNFAQANLGRVYAIYGRNSNNNITFNYSFSGPEKSTSEITQIVVNHSDAQSLTMNFAKFAGINELSTITYPMPGHSGQTATIRYNYDSAGDLLEVDKPGNDAAPNLSAYNVPAGDVPQTYGYTQPLQFLFACGPRATISLWQHSPNAATEGACMHFDFDSSVRLTDWQANGISNPPIGNGYLQPTQTGRIWGQINIASFVYGTVNNPPCSGTSAGTTTMCDSDGHSTIWTPDSSFRTTQTQVATGDPNPGPTAVVRTQTWDNNNNQIAFQTPQEFANGTTTNVTYDAQGNVTKVQLPSVSTSKGTLRPTATFTYDQFNNLTSACDPVYNATNNGACPTTHGSGSAVFKYDTASPDLAEPYGKVTDSYSPLGYHTQYLYSYNGQNEPGDYGLPTEILGDQVNQLDGSTPTPQRNITYDTYGNITSYGTGLGSWTATYNDDNWPTAATDPDNVTTRTCYNEDGSVSVSQSALQYKKDNYQACGSNSVSYTHDTDGNELTITNHFNDNAGITTNAYDGLDRLVEVDEPQGTTSRYFYDITQNDGGSPNLSIDGWGPAFNGYGNLYKVQRYFTVPGGQNNTWNDVNGNAFDAMDRAIKRFQRTPGSGTTFPGAMERWTTAYDASGQYGLLSSTTDPASVVTTFAFDGDARPASKTFSDGSTPNVTYVNDPDGRVQKATSSVFGDETYTYDANGQLTSYAEANQPNAMHPTISYGYYPNGWRSSLTINAGSLFNSNNPEFTYDYQKDGLRKTLTVAGKTSPFSWQYTPAGRLTSQSDPWTGNNINGTSYNLQAKALTFDINTSNATGVLTGITFPIGAVYRNMYHDAEGEVTSFGVGAPPAFTTQQNPSTYVTGAEIGYDNQGRLTSLAGTSPALGSGNYQQVIGTTYQYGRPAGPTLTIDPYTGSAVNTELPSGNCGNGNSYSGVPYLTFDSAGRDASTTTTGCYSGSYTSDQRTYDAENHTTNDTCTNDPSLCSSNAFTNTYGWAASGDLRTYSTQSSGATSNYRLHWDGSNLLFVTDSNGNLVQLSVEKLAIATYNPANNNETGFVVYDRDFTGTFVDQHGKAGDTGLNVMPSYSKLTNIKFGWSTTYLTGAFPAEGTSPTTPTFDMARTDGYQVGQLTLQGVRAFDPSIEQWTTPDSYRGNVNSPASQWAYAWNAGNPLTNQDPTGFEPLSATGLAVLAGVAVGGAVVLFLALTVATGGLDLVAVGLVAGALEAIGIVVEGADLLLAAAESSATFNYIVDELLTISVPARFAPGIISAGIVAGGVTADAVYNWADQQIPVGAEITGYTCVTLTTMGGVATSGACGWSFKNPENSVGDADNVLGDGTVGQIQSSIYGVNYDAWASQNADPYFDNNLMQ